MTPKGVFDRFRLDVADDKLPPLWTDIEVCGYLDDAQKWFCRLTEGLRDASSDATQIEIGANDPWVDVDPSVLRIRSATLQSTGKTVGLFSYEDVVGIGGTTHPFPFTPTEMSLTGVVVAAIVGMEEGRLRLVRIPAASDTLLLVVERLPVIPLTIEKDVKELPDELEIRDEHHLALLLWMKHLAYAKQDVETYDEQKSKDMEAAFRAYCAEAKAEKGRRNAKPRLIQYGGL